MERRNNPFKHKSSLHFSNLLKITKYTVREEGEERRFPFTLFLAVLLNPLHKPHVNSYLLRLWQTRLGYHGWTIPPGAGTVQSWRNKWIQAQATWWISWRAPHLEVVTTGLWRNYRTKRLLVFVSCELLYNPPSTAERTWLCALIKVAI